MSQITETHPRISERRAEVQDQSLRSRNRKLLVAGGVVLAVLLAAASTQSPLLDVDEVQVVGTVRTSPETIRELAAVELGTPLINLDHDSVVERLSDLPAVESVESSHGWGGAVTIEISERLPVARIDSPDGMVLIGDDGVVIDVLAPATPIEPVAPGSDENGVDGEATDGEATDGEDADGGEVEGGRTAPVVNPATTALPGDLEVPAISGVMFTTAPGKLVPLEMGDAILVAIALPADVASVTERIEITVDSLVLRLVGGGSVSLGDARDLEAKFETVRAFLAQVNLDCLETLNVQAPRVPVIVRRPTC